MINLDFDLSSTNYSENNIPDKYLDLTIQLDQEIISGSEIKYESPMGQRDAYFALCKKEIFIFVDDEMQIIPIRNIDRTRGSREGKFGKKKNLYGCELIWKLSSSYLNEYENKKLNKNVGFLDLDTMASAAAVEQMLGLKNHTTALFIGEIRGSGQYNSFGYTLIKLNERLANMWESDISDPDNIFYCYEIDWGSDEKIERKIIFSGYGLDEESIDWHWEWSDSLTQLEENTPMSGWSSPPLMVTSLIEGFYCAMAENLVPLSVLNSGVVNMKEYQHGLPSPFAPEDCIVKKLDITKEKFEDKLSENYSRGVWKLVYPPAHMSNLPPVPACVNKKF